MRNTKHKAQLVGLHAANILGFKGVEIELLGAFEFHSELGFFQKGQHYVDALSGSAEKYLKISQETQVNTKAMELRKGRLIDEGSLAAALMVWTSFNEAVR